MRLLGTMVMTCVAVLVLSACGGGEQESGGAHPQTSGGVAEPSATSSSTPSAPPTASSTPNGYVVGPATLSTAVDRFHRADSGHFTVTAFGTEGVAFLPRLEGRWSYQGRRSASTFRFVLPNRSEVTLNTVGVQDRVYTQPLGSGTRFTSTCWLRIPERLAAGGTFPAAVLAVDEALSDGERETMLLSDVLQAIGFVQPVRASRSALGSARVDVGFRVETGELTGWGVLDSDLRFALNQVRRTRALDRLRTALEAVPDAAWDIAFVGVGEPVRVIEPPARSLVEDEDFSACTRGI